MVQNKTELGETSIFYYHQQDAEWYLKQADGITISQTNFMVNLIGISKIISHVLSKKAEEESYQVDLLLKLMNRNFP